MDLEDLITNRDIEMKLYATIRQVADFYVALEQPKTKVVLSYKKAFVSFESLPNHQFIIEGILGVAELEFIRDVEVVDLSKNNPNFLSFIMTECWQGKDLKEKGLRLCHLFIIMAVYNCLMYFFSTEKNIASLSTSILSAVSVFVAIFSIFTANQNYIQRVNQTLFKTGKATYYFSVDRNMTIGGLIAIFASLAGIAIARDSNDSILLFKITDYISISDLINRGVSIKKALLFFISNIAFLMTYITLRSLIEFYVKRPALYQTGQMKDEFLKDY